MRTISVISLAAAVLLASLSGISASEKPSTGSNRLAKEASPYLRQHANNPVNWYPWGKEAFEKARNEDKPILLSVGYSTCHWCHVMERESFSAKDVAEIINKGFIAIKVDRERRPEVDEMYMLATQILNQTGGWPNNVFLTPDLKPFAALTYLPKDQFKELLNEVSTHWQTNPGPVMGQADRVGNVMARYMQTRIEARKITPAVLKNIVRDVTQNYDDFHGGIGVAPKFPQESLLLFLLDQAERHLNERARKVVLGTLDGMIRGGIRDQIGGGFHRYAIDPAWRVPHFEKMLYNQALISQALMQAYRMTGAERYRTALVETLDHVIRDMQLAEGGFATAFDAESKDPDGKKVEGAYYVWTLDQVTSALGNAQAATAAKLLGVTKDGNFNGTSIPHMPDWSSATTRAPLARLKAKLREARTKRPPPLRDDKVLTSWNALMIRALADASIQLAEPRYLAAATKAAQYLWNDHYLKPGELRRFSFEGKSSLFATQPDHAFLAMAFVALYDASGDATWLKRAEQLTSVMHDRFFDKAAGDYIMARTDDPLPPSKVRSDQPVPSGNAMALELYSRLARRTLSPDHKHRAHGLVAALSGAAVETAMSSGYVLKSADELLHGETGKIQFLGSGQVRVQLLQADDRRSARLKIAIANGWHINADKPLQDFYIPTTIKLLGPDKPKAPHQAFPKPLIQKLGFADEPMALYEGVFEVTVAMPKTGAGARAIQFSAQACSDKVCLDPETLVFTLTPRTKS